jgi:type II secretory pathway component GspD/PulD (secretin)
VGPAGFPLGPTAGPGGPTAQATGGAGGTQLATTKSTAIRFVTADGRPLQSRYLEDIHVTPDVRTNTLLISAPKETIDLIITLAKELDAIRPLKAEIRVFPLKNTDAATILSTLQQLFQSGAVGAAGVRPTGAPGLPGAPAGPAGPTAVPGGALTSILNGAPLVDLRLSYDPYTNSIIVAGAPQDLVTVEAIILRLEAATRADIRRWQVYQLHNATAADVATALTTFLTNSINVYKTAGLINSFQDVEREVVIVPDPITNKLLISATPQIFTDVMRLVAELDADIPQVVIQVLIADVSLTGSEEFGVEIGLQSPVLFNRSVFPATGFGGAFTSSFTASTASGPSTIPSGVTVTGTMNPATNLGFNFNNPAQGLGNNPVVNPGQVGFQGLGSLGVGRVSPTTGIGGFVFSAASDSFSLLIRALKTQGRIDILARPQVQTLDNQSARVFVGQNFPIIQGSTINAQGFAQAAVTYEPVGVELLVTPKINPDGKILMRVTPTVSTPQQTTVAVGNGIFAVAVNQETVDTTVIAQDGETVAIGGLIQRNDTKSENKIPWFGDLPLVGAAFRYRTQSKAKRELLVIMTPHIVKTRADADAILAKESSRMDWIVGDIARTHGTTGMEPIFATAPHVGGPNDPAGPNGSGPGCGAPGTPGPLPPGAPPVLPPSYGPAVPGQPRGEPLPPPPPLPQPLPPPGPGAAAPAVPAAPTAAQTQPPLQLPPQPQAMAQPAAPPPPPASGPATPPVPSPLYQPPQQTPAVQQPQQVVPPLTPAAGQQGQLPTSSDRLLMVKPAQWAEPQMYPQPQPQLPAPPRR